MFGGGTGRAFVFAFRDLLLEVVFFFVLVMLLSFFYSNNLLLTALLIAYLGVIWKFFPKKADIYYFLPAAILGPIGEVIAISYGVWQYANPTILGVPLWLPIGWGLSAMIALRIAHTIAGMSGVRLK
jgi:hypothetical protein